MGYIKGVYLATDATGWSSFTGKLDTGSSSGWANQQGSGYPAGGQNGDGTRYIYISTSGANANPGTSASPKQTLGAGLGLLRNGKPDWLMLKKGDTWTNENFDDISAIGGLDATNLMLITAYDPANPSVANPSTGGAPPIVQTSNGKTFLFDHGSFFGLVGITAYSYQRDPNNGAYVGLGNSLESNGMYTVQPVHTIIIEDVEFNYYLDGTAYAATSAGCLMDDILIRRTVVYNCYTEVSTHSVGFENQAQVSNMVYEEVASNHNGWLGTLDAFSRGFYLSTSGESQFHNPTTVRGCIIANDSSETQVRAGGYISNNLSFNNQACINLAAPEASVSYTYSNNVNLTSLGAAFIAAQGLNNFLNQGSTEISGNIFSHETGTRTAIAIAAGNNGCSTHDNIVYKWTTLYGDSSGCPISFDTIVGGSGFTTGNDFYFTCPSTGVFQGGTYSDGLGNIFTINAELGQLPATYFYSTRTTTGSAPTQSGTLTKTGGGGAASITYTNAYRIFYNIPMKYVTSGSGTLLGCTCYANMSGAIAIVQLATGVYNDLTSPGPNYTQAGNGYSVGDQVTNTSAFGGGTGFSCKVHAVGVNTVGTNKHDPTGSLHAGGSFPEWIDPERSVASYAASIGLAGTEAAFLEAVRTNRKWNYDPRYTANAANNYFRAGFGIGSGTTPPVLMAQICM